MGAAAGLAGEVVDAALGVDADELEEEAAGLGFGDGGKR
jgi:hypothetical protein